MLNLICLRSRCIMRILCTVRTEYMSMCTWLTTSYTGTCITATFPLDCSIYRDVYHGYIPPSLQHIQGRVSQGNCQAPMSVSLPDCHQRCFRRYCRQRCSETALLARPERATQLVLSYYRLFSSTNK